MSESQERSEAEREGKVRSWRRSVAFHVIRTSEQRIIKYGLYDIGHFSRQLADLQSPFTAGFVKCLPRAGAEAESAAAGRRAPATRLRYDSTMTSEPQTFVYKRASGVDIHADVYLPSDESKHALPILLWWAARSVRRRLLIQWPKDPWRRLLDVFTKRCVVLLSIDLIDKEVLAQVSVRT